jgi:hypothetical protein
LVVSVMMTPSLGTRLTCLTLDIRQTGLPNATKGQCDVTHIG